jgi:hypothetical protein
MGPLMGALLEFPVPLTPFTAGWLVELAAAGCPAPGRRFDVVGGEEDEGCGLTPLTPV